QEGECGIANNGSPGLLKPVAEQQSSHKSNKILKHVQFPGEDDAYILDEVSSQKTMETEAGPSSPRMCVGFQDTEVSDAGFSEAGPSSLVLVCDINIQQQDATMEEHNHSDHNAAGPSYYNGPMSNISQDMGQMERTSSTQEQ
ncbi:unnamed protein product, partial [Meganyctiphanes norvegica]